MAKDETTTETEEAPVANEEADRVILSTPEQKELREDSEIELDESIGVPGQIQYPEDSAWANRADPEGEPVAADE